MAEAKSGGIGCLGILFICFIVEAILDEMKSGKATSSVASSEAATTSKSTDTPTAPESSTSEGDVGSCKDYLAAYAGTQCAIQVIDQVGSYPSAEGLSSSRANMESSLGRLSSSSLGQKCQGRGGDPAMATSQAYAEVANGFNETAASGSAPDASMINLACVDAARRAIESTCSTTGDCV